MPMSAGVDKRIESLRFEAQPICHLWLDICKSKLLIDVRVIETLRPEDRQKELAATGKSLVPFGWHNVGLAWDFAVFRDGKYLTDDASGLYTKCGLIGEALDCVWGGRWQRLKDYGHLEWHPGFTLQQFLNGQKDGAVT